MRRREKWGYSTADPNVWQVGNGGRAGAFRRFISALCTAPGIGRSHTGRLPERSNGATHGGGSAAAARMVISGDWQGAEPHVTPPLV
jgi:hypothetical protein